MVRRLRVGAASAALALSLSAASFIALGANLAACSSFSEDSQSPGAADAASDAVSPPDGALPDGALPDGASPGAGACAPLVCPTTTPNVCERFDLTPDSKWKREPGGDVGALFFPTAGCAGGGGLRVSGAAATNLTSDMFFTEVGTTKASKVKVVFDVFYELTGSFGNDEGYIDLLQISTAPRSGRAGASSLSISTTDGESYATIYQPNKTDESKVFRLSQKQWHRVEVSQTFGTAAKLELVVDGTPPIVLASTLEVSGNPELGAAIALGRWSEGTVPAITIAFDNVAIAVE